VEQGSLAMKTRTLIGFIVVAVLAFLGGNLSGFFLGVLATKEAKAFLTDALADEQPADVAKPHHLVRNGFRLDYPGNWRIDSDDEDYDPDSFFSIDSPGSSYASFHIWEGASDPNHNVEILVDKFNKILSSSQSMPLKRWGRFQGEGVHLKGRLMGLKSSVKIFSCSTLGKSFTIINQCCDSDLLKAEPGFKLIERTFELKEPVRK
jgi:hypothetical protein